LAGSDEHRGRSRRLGVEDWKDRAQVGVLSGQTIGRLVMSCAIRIVHMEETRTTGFLV
jgi:hypothetical protein